MIALLIGVLLNIISFLSVAFIYTRPHYRFIDAYKNMSYLFKRSYIEFSLSLITPFLLAFITVCFYICLLLNLIPNDNDDTTS